MTALLALAAPRLAFADVDVSAKVQAALFERGLKLFHEGRWADARQLFLEAMAESPRGAYADTALEMVHRCEEKLGMAPTPAPVLPPPAPIPLPAPKDTTPIDPYAEAPPAPRRADAAPLDPYADPSTTAPKYKETVVIDPYAPGPDEPLAQPALAPRPRPKLDLEAPYGDNPATADRAPDTRNIWIQMTVFGAAWGGGFGGLLGAATGSNASLAGGVVLGLAGGGGAAYLLSRAHPLDQGQAQAIMSTSIWGGVIGGLFTFIADNPKLCDGCVDGPEDVSHTAYDAAIAAVSAVGLGGGVAWALLGHPTNNTITLANSFGGIGLGAGLMLGVMMNPPDDRAYAVNALIGSAAGIGFGLWLSTQTDVAPARMLIVDGSVAAGGLLGYVVFSGLGAGSDVDKRRFAGGASLITAFGGGVAAWFLTRGMHAAEDKGAAKALLGAPPSLVVRGSDGKWRVSAPAPMPIPNGAGVSLIGGTF